MFELSEGPPDKMGGLVVRARSKYTFQSTAGLLLTWRVMLDGVPLHVGDPAQGDSEGWYPGGSVPLAPQVWCGILVTTACSSRTYACSMCNTWPPQNREHAFLEA